ncbi:hypothetical protein EDD29_6872 [Actinocorallia herbida]|uniref:Uncharacterized protein n=1 Tax=Actinocorallia herbida TaxID=58109 RepID=A0A3N1D6N1_9ACTN|nr:hypothetical protein [Actinocorallia herbida]ROO89185.1 hypothetical protein EDD29_6872 [Actinocorallia herbida]
MTPDRIGVLVGAVFGLVWVEVNAGAAGAPVDLVLRIGGAVVFLAVLGGLWRARKTPAPDEAGRPGFGPGYRLVLAVELAAFLGGNALLNGPLDLPDAVPAWIAFVVGAHFVALARVWREPSIGWVGGAAAVLGAVGVAMAAAGASGDAVALTSGVGTGIVLLGGCGWTVLRVPARAA